MDTHIEHTPLPWTEGEGWRIESKTAGGGSIVVASEGSIGDYRDRAFILRAANSHEALLEACKCAQELIGVARQYFPKSVRNSDTFTLENTNAAIGKAIAKANGGER